MALSITKQPDTTKARTLYHDWRYVMETDLHINPGAVLFVEFIKPIPPDPLGLGRNNKTIRIWSDSILLTESTATTLPLWGRVPSGHTNMETTRTLFVQYITDYLQNTVNQPAGTYRFKNIDTADGNPAVRIDFDDKSVVTPLMDVDQQDHWRITYQEDVPATRPVELIYRVLDNGVPVTDWLQASFPRQSTAATLSVQVNIAGVIKRLLTASDPTDGDAIVADPEAVGLYSIEVDTRAVVPGAGVLQGAGYSPLVKSNEVHGIYSQKEQLPGSVYPEAYGFLFERPTNKLPIHAGERAFMRFQGDPSESYELEMKGEAISHEVYYRQDQNAIFPHTVQHDVIANITPPLGPEPVDEIIFSGGYVDVRNWLNFVPAITWSIIINGTTVQTDTTDRVNGYETVRIQFPQFTYDLAGAPLNEFRITIAGADSFRYVGNTNPVSFIDEVAASATVPLPTGEELFEIPIGIDAIKGYGVGEPVDFTFRIRDSRGRTYAGPLEIFYDHFNASCEPLGGSLYFLGLHGNWETMPIERVETEGVDQGSFEWRTFEHPTTTAHNVAIDARKTVTLVTQKFMPSPKVKDWLQSFLLAPMFIWDGIHLTLDRESANVFQDREAIQITVAFFYEKYQPTL